MTIEETCRCGRSIVLRPHLGAGVAREDERRERERVDQEIRAWRRQHKPCRVAPTTRQEEGPTWTP